MVTTTLRCRSLAHHSLIRVIRTWDAGRTTAAVVAAQRATSPTPVPLWPGSAGPSASWKPTTRPSALVQGVVQIPGETLLPECVAACGHGECPLRSPVTHVLLLAFAYLLVRSVQRLWHEDVRW